MTYGLIIYAEPTVEPVSRSELKDWLRIDNTDMPVTVTQSIAPGAHVIAAAYSLLGTGVAVTGYTATVYFVSGTNGTGGTVDVKIQESADNSTYTDWTGGAFTQVTTANDNATYSKAYTGDKAYIRVVSTVATATCEFGVNVATQTLTTDESTVLDNCITTARKMAEIICGGRAFTNTTYDLTLDTFPSDSVIEIPRSPLVSAVITYQDTANATQTVDAALYTVDIKREPPRIIPAYNQTWPSTYGHINDVTVRFIAGYGATAASVPTHYRVGIKMLAAYLYENREGEESGTLSIPSTIKALLQTGTV